MLSRSFSLSSPVEDHALVRLPRATQDELRRQIRRTVAHVLQSMGSGEQPLDTHWKLKQSKKGLDYYVDQLTPHEEQFRFCCVGQTDTPLVELMNLFMVSDNQALLRQSRVLYDNVLDAHVVSVLDEPSSRAPFASTYVRYTSFASPKPLDDRDMSVVVATDVVTQSDDATVGYCLWDSVQLPECPDLWHAQGIQRSRMVASGFVFRQSRDAPHATQILYFVGVEAGGLALRIASWLAMERQSGSLARLLDHFRRKKLDPATFCPRDQWPPSREATHCHGCVKKFNSFAKRLHCVACGYVFCSTCCCTKEKVDLPGVGITALKFCALCLSQRGVRESLVSTTATVTASSSLSLSSSFSSSKSPDSMGALKRPASQPTMHGILDSTLHGRHSSTTKPQPDSTSSRKLDPYHEHEREDATPVLVSDPWQ